MEAVNGQDGARKREFFWLAGAVGTAVGVAVWKYRQKEPSYWERSKAAAGHVATTATNVNPWLMIGTGTAALGGAAIANRLRRRENTWQKATRRAEEFGLHAGKQLRPWLGLVAAVAATAEASRARKRARRASEGLATTGLRIWRRLQTI